MSSQPELLTIMSLIVILCLTRYLPGPDGEVINKMSENYIVHTNVGGKKNLVSGMKQLALLNSRYASTV